MSPKGYSEDISIFLGLLRLCQRIAHRLRSFEAVTSGRNRTVLVGARVPKMSRGGKHSKDSAEGFRMRPNGSR